MCNTVVGRAECYTSIAQVIVFKELFVAAVSKFNNSFFTIGISDPLAVHIVVPERGI